MNTPQNICTGTGVIIFKEGKILLGVRSEGSAKGQYSLPGGKVDDGESFEMCAKREVLEECGLVVGNLKFNSVSNIAGHKYDRLVSVIFTAKWQEGEPITNPEEKIGDWKWYDMDHLPEPLFNLTKIAIECYKNGQNFFDIA